VKITDKAVVGHLKLRITEVTDTSIICGSWTFDRYTGAEIDEDLGWGPSFGRTGSYLVGFTTDAS
jgi:hypothetical protein